MRQPCRIGGLLFFQRCGWLYASLLRSLQTTIVTRITDLSVQKRRASHISRLHETKCDDGLVFCAGTNPKATKLSHCAPAQIQTRQGSRIPRLHDFESDKGLAFRACTTPTATRVSHFSPVRMQKRYENLAFHACINPKTRRVSHFAPATRVSHIAPAGTQRRRGFRISRQHKSKSDEGLAFRACPTPKPTAPRACTNPKTRRAWYFAASRRDH